VGRGVRDKLGGDLDRAAADREAIFAAVATRARHLVGFQRRSAS
jgi:hypothetical protein